MKRRIVDLYFNIVGIVLIVIGFKAVRMAIDIESYTPSNPTQLDATTTAVSVVILLAFTLYIDLTRNNKID